MRSWSIGILFSAAAAAAAGPQDFFGGNNHEDYLSWFNDNGLSYETSTFLPQLSDDMQGMSLHWNVDETHLTLAVAVRATGWVAFGLSENGGMAGADVFFYQVASEKLTDGHILDDKIMPFEDCQQDWELVSSMHDEDSEFLIVEVRRLLDTKDPQDRVIIEDGTLELPPSLVIGAWGDGEMSFHGEKRARSAIRWYNHELSGEEAFSTLMNQESEGHFQMQARDHQIKTIETEYVDICFTWDDLLAQGIPDGVFNVVGFRPIVEAVEHLHHYTLFGSADTMNGEPCEAFKEHQDLVYGWARGEPPVALPLNVGLKLGPEYYRSFRLEIHYDNPFLKDAPVDNSGIRFYYTTKEREHELGLLQLGDPSLFYDQTPLGDGLTEHSFYCSPDCTTSVLRQEVTVLREYMHMHDRGAGARNELIRDGEIVHKGVVEFFRFDQQGNQLIRQLPYTVKPGDAWNTVCNFDNRDEGRFGYASGEEMCMGFLMYYPRQFYLGFVPWFCDPDPDLGFPPCVAQHNVTTIESVPRIFGVEGEQCEEPNAPSTSSNVIGFAPALAILAAVWLGT